MTQFRTLYHGAPSKSFFGGKFGLFLIRRSGVWANRWRELHEGSRPGPPPPPLIDLARETVIVLAVGTRPVLGYDVTVEEVTVRDRVLAVTGTERRNVGGGFDEICSPVHIVAAPIGPRSFDEMALNLRIRLSDT